MNLDEDFVNWTGYDTPEDDYFSEDDSGSDEEAGHPQATDQGRVHARGGNGGESDDEDDAAPSSKRESLGDVAAEWVKSERNKRKVDPAEWLTFPRSH
jgi:hypothetical protein